MFLIAVRALHKNFFSVLGLGGYISILAGIAGMFYFSVWTSPLVASLLGLRVEKIFVEGRRRSAAQDIRRALGVTQGSSVFKANLQESLARLEALPWIRSAVVERRLPSQIYVRLCEREPIAVWKDLRGVSYLVDREGAQIIALTKPQEDAWKHVLHILGRQAPQQVSELMGALTSLGFQQVRAALFLPSGRWDLFLKNGMRVQLPEGPAVHGLQRFLALDASLLQGVSVVDLRNPGTVFVKWNHPKVPKPPTLGPKKRL